MYIKGILAPGLKLIGAKTKIRDRLYPLFPEHDVYIEPFLGSGGVLIGKEPAAWEIVGDSNKYLINYYKVIQKDPDKFWKRFEEMYETFITLESLGKTLGFSYLKNSFNFSKQTSIDKAVCFYLIVKHCMNGIWRLNKQGICNSSYCGTIAGRGVFTREWFDLVIERIKNVEFKQADYKTFLIYLMQTQDTNKMFTFLDPPYHSCKTIYNGQAWGDKEFQDFKSVLDKLPGKWLLTINRYTTAGEEDKFIKDLFDGYNFIENNGIGYSCSQTAAGRGKKDEWIITNY